MEVTTILKAFLKADREQPHTPSETRLYFALLGLFQERADEKGQFVATLDDVCKRYGTTCKKHIRKTRETLCKKGIIQYFVTDCKSSIYVLVDGYKNIPTQGYKNITTDWYKDIPAIVTDLYKNIPTIDKEDIPKFGKEDIPKFDKEDIPTLSSTPEPRKRKTFAASTPFGKIEYHTEEAAREASIFCEKAMRQLYSTNKLKEIQAFCLHWLAEDKKTKKPLFKTKQDFYLPYEFKKFKEAQTE